MLHVQPKIGMARFYIEETYGTRTSDIFREGSHQHGTSCEGQKKGTQIWVNGRLHAMLVFFRFGASILYNINWARGLTYLCTVDVRAHLSLYRRRSDGHDACRMFRKVSQVMDEFYYNFCDCGLWRLSTASWLR